MMRAVMGSLLLLVVAATAVMAQPAPPATTTTTTTTTTTASTTTTTTPTAKGDGVLRANWAALLKSGCDLKRQGVATPIDARVLRNTPFAMKGRAFKAAELTTLFGSDGGWYVADPTANPGFAGAEQACIDRLQKHETALRKSIAFDPVFEARFTATLEAVTALRDNSAGFGADSLRLQAFKEDGQPRYVFSEKSCSTTDEDQGGGCSSMMLLCDAEHCLVFAAG